MGMRQTISIPKAAYQKLLKKAQLIERFRAILQQEYPLEEYTDSRLKEFERNDRISLKLKKEIISILGRRA